MIMDNQNGTLPWTGERYVPSLHGDIEMEHLARYALSLEIAHGKRVLDIACGEGYGSYLLSEVSHTVIGVDISKEAVQHASNRYIRNNLAFKVGSCTDIPLADHCIDLIVSFETIEHLAEHDEMLKECKRVLTHDGVIIISTPNKYLYSDVPNGHNPFHVKELYFDDFNQLMRKYFHNVEMYTQGNRYGSMINSMNASQIPQLISYSGNADMMIHTKGTFDNMYYIAVSSDAAIPQIPVVLFDKRTNIAQLENKIAQEQVEVQITKQKIAELQSELIQAQIDKQLIMELQNERIEAQLAMQQLENQIAQEQIAAKSAIQQLENQIAQEQIAAKSATQQLENQVAELQVNSLKLTEEYQKELLSAKHTGTTLNQAIFMVNEDWQRTSKKLIQLTEMLLTSISWKLGNTIAQLATYYRKWNTYDANYELRRIIEQLSEPHRIESNETLAQNAEKFTSVLLNLRHIVTQVAKSKRYKLGKNIILLLNRLRWKTIYPNAIDQIYDYIDTAVSRNIHLVKSAIAPNTEVGNIHALTEPITIKYPTSHVQSVDIIICVHNAFDDVKNCIASTLSHTTEPYTIIIVDDGSQEETRDYLKQIANAYKHKITLLRNETARGYTFAANQGLKSSTADFVVLLNSDTIVTPYWIDKMVACGNISDTIGAVGPLSNTASWQSIPELENSGDWADNALPQNLSIEEMGNAVARINPHEYPSLPFLNGFCYMIKRSALKKVGFLDEDHFGRGYGEENDYSIRLQKNGFTLAVADDTYVFHHQSRSYSHEKRKQLSDYAYNQLITLYGANVIEDNVQICKNNPTLQSIRMRQKYFFQQYPKIDSARKKYAHKKVAFILPVNAPGGGANVVLQEALAMQEFLHVDVALVNLYENKSGFNAAYPHNELPVIWIDFPENLNQFVADFDAVIATYHLSVYWLAHLNNSIKKGYYIQDFEPLFFDKNSKEWKAAIKSYDLFPNELYAFTKTAWNQSEVFQNTGHKPAVIGPSVDIQTFAPRKHATNWPQRPLRILAMIRLESSIRNPQFTLIALHKIFQKHGGNIEITIFGCEASNPLLPRFVFQQGWVVAGILTKPQTAKLFSEMDIFIDFSKYQAMGLTSMEAMACGVAVIVPKKGGSVEFATHYSNAIVVDTSDEQSCVQALDTLIMNKNLRESISQQAAVDMVKYMPIYSGIHILDAIFGKESAA